MAKIKVIKKNDEYSSDYKVGDILEVTGPGTVDLM